MSNGNSPKPQGPKRSKPLPSKVIPARVRNDPSRGWTIVPPHCTIELEPDLEDVEMLLKEGDAESARDAALYLLEECQDMTAAHELLGRIAEGELNDSGMAQGHYGYVFELTLKWLGPFELAPMDSSRKINRISLKCAEGLMRVLQKRGEVHKASQVQRYVAAWKGETGPRERPAAAPNTGGGPSPSGSPKRPWSGPKSRRPMLPRPKRQKPGGESPQ
jgi:hypothetical protein